MANRDASVASTKPEADRQRRRIALTAEEVVELRVPRGAAVPKAGSLWATLPALPALVFLLVVLAYSSAHVDAVRAAVWRTVRQSFRHAAAVPAARVWVRRDTGSFYCRGSVLFGTGPGRLLEQDEALTLGYQPATGSYCPADPAGAALSARNAAR